MISRVANIYLVIVHYIQGGYRPLHFAAGNNSKECLELLLLQGADINIRNSVSNINRSSKIDYECSFQDMCTPLHYAAGKGHKECLELLLSNGAEINAQNIVSKDRTVFHIQYALYKY